MVQAQPIPRTTQPQSSDQMKIGDDAIVTQSGLHDNQKHQPARSQTKRITSKTVAVYPKEEERDNQIFNATTSARHMAPTLGPLSSSPPPEKANDYSSLEGLMTSLAETRDNQAAEDGNNLYYTPKESDAALKNSAPAAVSDIAQNSERLQELVRNLRETHDEKDAGTIALEISLRIKNHDIAVPEADISIITAMKRFSNSSKVQSRGCKALAEVAAKGLSNVESLVDKGGPEMILTAMEKHRAEEDLQKEACRAIEVITKKYHKGKHAFGVNGHDAIVALIKSMEDHSSSPKIQRLNCRALASLVGEQIESSRILVAEGGLKAIRQALKNHDSSIEVIENAFDLLFSVLNSANSYLLDEEVAMTISVERILSIMTFFRDNEKMLGQGLNLLCLCCRESPRNRSSVASLYSFEVILGSLDHCIHNKEILRNGTTLIQYLSQTEGNAVAAGLMSEGGMELLLNAIRRHISDAAIVEQVSLIVAKMARPFSDKIRKEGGIELLLSGMRRHDETVDVQRAACLALWKLSTRPENASIIHVNGGIKLINDALTRFAGDDGVSDAACEALALLTDDKELLMARQSLMKARKRTEEIEPATGCLGCGIGCI